MPKMDGVKVLKEIRHIEKKNIKSGNGAKIIMTSALNETTFIHNSFDIGCDAYTAKPIDLDRFMRC